MTATVLAVAAIVGAPLVAAVSVVAVDLVHRVAADRSPP